jgi:hypothetical protein
MDQGALVREQIDAGARFLLEFQKPYPVQSAFWVKEGETGDWYLYIASDRITDENFDVVYGEVIRISGLMKDPWFDPFQVKVIGEDDPMAKAVFAAQHNYSGPIPTRFRGRSFGGRSVDEIYLYPSPIVAA